MSENALPYTLTNESITVVYEGKPHVVRKGTANFAPLRQAIIEDNWDAVPQHLTIGKSLAEYAKDQFTYDGHSFFFKGEPLTPQLNDRIKEMHRKGDDPAPLFKFWERLQKNPSYRSVQQLFNFSKAKGIPITEDGCFLAYKSVRNDYKDHHSGQFDNSPGKTNEMPRNQVSDDPEVECHEGFHVGALEYAQTFGSGDRRIVICKIDPENVVSVPRDHYNQKMRVCKYTVVGNHNGQHMPGTLISDEDIPVKEPIKTSGGDEIREVDDDDIEDGDGDEYEEHEDEVFDSPPTAVELEKQEEAAQEKAAEAVQKKPVTKKWEKYNKMKAAELMTQSIDTLRQYAGKGLEIVGASKIQGGKVALVKKILETR